MTPFGMQPHEAILDRYRETVVPQPHASIAECLLAYWDRPWSPAALRFAYFAMAKAQRHGLDVLEYPDSI